MKRGLIVAVGLSVACGQAEPSTTESSSAASTSGAPRALEEEMDLVRRSFRRRRVTLRIVDMHMKSDLAPLIRASESAVFALNGGFFDGRGEPIGLALSNGHLLSPHDKRPGGVLLFDDDIAGSLHDAETFELPKDGPRFGIQAGPRLVVGGHVNILRDDGKRAERIALCLGAGGHVLDVVMVRGKGSELGPTLFELAQWLAAHNCVDSLNLDGGPSAGIAWREGDDVREIAPRGPVRHAIVIHTTDVAVLPP